MIQFQSTEVRDAFERMPRHIREQLLSLRALIFQVGLQAESTAEITEALRWGEPSYLTKSGSTIRLGWKSTAKDEYMMLFNCNSRLVATFKRIYPEAFEFRSNRAIVFKSGERIPTKALEHCIALALNYHRVKHLPLLGA